MSDETFSLDLIVPDVDTDTGSSNSGSEKERQEKERQIREEKERELFQEDTNENIIPSPYECDETLISRSTEEQINKDTVRTVYVTEEDNLRYPCVILDFTNAINMSMIILREIYNVIENPDEIVKLHSKEEAEQLLENLDTNVYTKYGDKTVLIGMIDKNKWLRLIIKLLEQAKIGELGKNYTIKLAQSKEKGFENMNENNSCDFIQL